MVVRTEGVGVSVKGRSTSSGPSRREDGRGETHAGLKDAHQQLALEEVVWWSCRRLARALLIACSGRYSDDSPSNSFPLVAVTS